MLIQGGGLRLAAFFVTCPGLRGGSYFVIIPQGKVTMDWRTTAAAVQNRASAISSCRACGGTVSITAKVCPHCGQDSPALGRERPPLSPRRAHLGTVVVVLAGVLATCSVMFSGYGTPEVKRDSWGTGYWTVRAINGPLGSECAMTTVEDDGKGIANFMLVRLPGDSSDEVWVTGIKGPLPPRGGDSFRLTIATGVGDPWVFDKAARDDWVGPTIMQRLWGADTADFAADLAKASEITVSTDIHGASSPTFPVDGFAASYAQMDDCLASLRTAGR